MSHAEKLIGLPLLVRIRYVRCGLHRPPVIRETLKSLGLTRLQQEVVHKNIRPIRGKIHVVKHFIKLEPIYYKGPRTPDNRANEDPLSITNPQQHTE